MKIISPHPTSVYLEFSEATFNYLFCFFFRPTKVSE